MRKKVLNQQQTYHLIKEMVEKKIEEQDIKEATAAFRREVLQNLAEEMMGEGTDVSQIEEGMMSNLWDKAKGLIGGTNKQQASFTRAIEKATNRQTQQFLNDLEDVAPGFPNTKGKSEDAEGNQVDRFSLGLALIQTTYSLLAQKAATAKSKAERMTAAAAANDIVAYAKDAVGDVSRTYKYFKEEEEADAAFLEEGAIQLDEVNLQRLVRLVDAGKLSPMDAIHRIENSPANLRPDVKRGVIDQIKKAAKDRSDSAEYLRQPYETPSDAPAPSTADAPDVPDADPMDYADGQFPSPDPGDYEGQGSPWEIDPEWQPDATPGLDAGVGIDAGGAGEAAAAAAEGGSDMINVLGVPIATKLAIGLGLGVTAAVVGVGLWKTYKYLQKKKKDGHSREGLLNDTVKQLKPIQPKLDTAPETVPGEKATQASTADASQTAPAVSPAGAQQTQDTAQGTNARIGKQTPGTYHAQGQDQATQQGAAPEWDSELGAQPAQKDGESDEAYASRLKMAAAARRRGVTEMKRLRQLAGLKILQS